jgi:hypothetical protein
MSGRLGRKRRKENHRVITSGTSIQPRSRMTAGAIMKRAADLECWVAMTQILCGRVHTPDCIFKRNVCLQGSPEAVRTPPPVPGAQGLAVAGCFHCFVGDGLGFFQGLFNGLLASIGSREFLAYFRSNTGKFWDRRELDANVRRTGSTVGLCRISRQDRVQRHLEQKVLSGTLGSRTEKYARPEARLPSLRFAATNSI